MNTTYLSRTLDDVIQKMYWISSNINYVENEGDLTAAYRFLKDYKELLDKISNQQIKEHQELSQMISDEINLNVTKNPRDKFKKIIIK